MATSFDYVPVEAGGIIMKRRFSTLFAKVELMRNLAEVG
jgi:hypothetical protein